MDRRIFGLENEYGVTCTFRGQRRLSPDEVARYLFRRVVHWGRSSNVFLENGARLYLDVGSHPEYATPECDQVLDLIAHDKAGERILEALLSAAEVRALLSSADGLVRVRGQWVELDRARLREVLDHWERVRRAVDADGLSFLEGMRLLAGATQGEQGESAHPAGEGWSRVEAGAWLAQTLAGLRGPAALATPEPGTELRGALRPYQRIGVSWLAFASSLRLGVCLADDMGLGKTIQVLALLLLLKRRRQRGDPPHLLVVPASLNAATVVVLEPRAITSGLTRPSAVGPSEEKLDTAPVDVTEPTVISRSASAGAIRCDVAGFVSLPSFPAALVIGAEAHGPGAESRALETTSVKIPLSGGVESLNAAVAGAIILFEVARQRRRGPRRGARGGSTGANERGDRRDLPDRPE